MSAPRFAVTGTGRCGTGYIAAVLRRCGVKCGHENWWTADPKRVQDDLDGDSSWLALPAVEAGEWSGPVVHVVRHPVSVVRSFVGLGFPDWLSLPYVPDLAALPQPQLAIEFWCRWNDRCAAVADVTVRVEDALSYLDHMSKVVECPLCAELAAQVPTRYNSRRRAAVDEEDIWRLLHGRAERFGYTP